MAEIELAVMLASAILCMVAAVVLSVLVAVVLLRRDPGDRPDALETLTNALHDSNQTLQCALDQALMHAMANSEDSRLVMSWYTDRKAAEATLAEMRAVRDRRPSRVVPEPPPEPSPDQVVSFGGDETDTTG